MKSIEFMYWLQGYFEICEVEKFTPLQLSKIKNHLQMASITDKTGVLPFCTWLKGFLESVETEVPSVNQTTKIKNKLNNLFVHVLTPQPASEVAINHTRNQTGMGLNSSDVNVFVKC